MGKCGIRTPQGSLGFLKCGYVCHCGSKTPQLRRSTPSHDKARRRQGSPEHMTGPGKHRRRSRRGASRKEACLMSPLDRGPLCHQFVVCALFGGCRPLPSRRSLLKACLAPCRGDEHTTDLAERAISITYLPQASSMRVVSPV